MNAGKQLSVRLPRTDIEKVEQCVKKGYAMNTADFIRQAVREKCIALGVEIETEKQVQMVFPGGA